MKFAMCLEAEVTPKWTHARQMGVDHAVVLGPPEPTIRPVRGLEMSFSSSPASAMA